MNKQVKIEYLYLDLVVCDRCVGTDQVLDDAVSAIKPVLEMAGYTIDYQKKEMSTISDAIEYKFLSSPTIRVNDRDICSEVKENDCGCCGDISGTAVTCRVFTYEGKDYEVPPKAMLVEAILKAVFGAETENAKEEIYNVPQNLKDFYRGKFEKSGGCCCGGSGCCCC